MQHLDIKPQNLFLVHNHVKVADFGLVKDLEGHGRRRSPAASRPVYAAPETFDGWVSRFSDQYSLAIVYQELLTGQRPFTGNNVRQLIMQHLQGAPNLSPLPAADRPALARALAKKPDDRFPTCLDFVQALKEGIEAVAERLAEESIAEMEPPLTQVVRSLRPTRPTPPPRRKWRPRGVARASIDAAPDPLFGHGAAGREEARLASARRHAQEEERGEGLLFPALVIGLGQAGYHVVKELRHKVRGRFGEIERLPSLRLLYIDSDPDSFHNALQAPLEEALGVEEILLTRLNRSARYLRPRESLPPLDDWLDLKMIHRIPRNPVTMGIRALGRLAFVDNYRSIVARLRRDLERITAPEGLTAAAKDTGLGKRSNWPRVYLVAHLGGGTGGGMFLDLAYVVRARLLRDGLCPARSRGPVRHARRGGPIAASVAPGQHPRRPHRAESLPRGRRDLQGPLRAARRGPQRQ